PAGIASTPYLDTRAIVEFYTADAFSWRGWFAVHPWVAVKAKNATEYKVYQVMRWQVSSTKSAIRQHKTPTPDRYWYGSKSELLLSIKGEEAAELIPKVQAAVALYLWKYEYSVFLGPNSNTFIAWIGLQVLELNLELPLSAIGSGYAKKLTANRRCGVKLRAIQRIYLII
ncbi:MAG TPA: hypothetical protein DIS98_14915, partial [Colwellia sp.]|nr:hypothetical protein [Colwellia sp.]